LVLGRSNRDAKIAGMGTSVRRSAFGLLVAAAIGSGCSRDDELDVSGDEAMKHLERISYYDRNGDGKIDEELHRYVGAHDADWTLRDNDYDGRFEKKILYGISIFEKAVDLPVPTGLPISASK
jgi:hypothetical protein